MHIVLIIPLVAIGTLTAIGAANDVAITRHTIDGGGGTSSGGGFVLSGTIGQPDAGAPLTGDAFVLSGGFWGGGSVTSPPPCPADTNGDGSVDVTDLLAVLAEWGLCEPGCAGDTNDDGMVDVTDLLAVLAEWGECPA